MADPVYREPPYERKRGGNGLLIALLVLAALAVLAFATGLIKLGGDSGKLPDVSVSGGRAPDVDVETGKVVVGTTKEEVEVPDIDIDTKTTTIDAPAIGVQSADEPDKK